MSTDFSHSFAQVLWWLLLATCTYKGYSLAFDIMATVWSCTDTCSPCHIIIKRISADPQYIKDMPQVQN